MSRPDRLPATCRRWFVLRSRYPEKHTWQDSESNFHHLRAATTSHTGLARLRDQLSLGRSRAGTYWIPPRPDCDGRGTRGSRSASGGTYARPLAASRDQSERPPTRPSAANPVAAVSLGILRFVFQTDFGATTRACFQGRAVPARVNCPPIDPTLRETLRNQG